MVSPSSAQVEWTIDGMNGRKLCLFGSTETGVPQTLYSPKRALTGTRSVHHALSSGGKGAVKMKKFA